MKISISIAIECQPAELFPWLADRGKAMLWQMGVRDAEIIMETPDVVGTTFRELLDGGRNTLVIKGVVTEYIRDRAIAFHLSSRIHELDASYTIEGEPGGSKLTAVADIKWKFPTSILVRLRSKHVQLGIWQQTKAELNELKRLCEAEAAV